MTGLLCFFQLADVAADVCLSLGGLAEVFSGDVELSFKQVEQPQGDQVSGIVLIVGRPDQPVDWLTLLAGMGSLKY